MDLKTQAHSFELERTKMQKGKYENELKLTREQLQEANKEKKDLKEANASMLKKESALVLQKERYQQEILTLTSKKTDLASNSDYDRQCY